MYMMDIHKDQVVYLEEPDLKIPEKKGIRGRKPFLPKPDKESIRVDNYQKHLSPRSMGRDKDTYYGKRVSESKVLFCPGFHLEQGSGKD